MRRVVNIDPATHLNLLMHSVDTRALVWAGRLGLVRRPLRLIVKRTTMAAVNRDLPTSGYALEVDGRLKAEFATVEGARSGAEELKRRFPVLRVRIYDAQTKAREEIALRRAWDLGDAHHRAA
jgi:hypothetical protein